MEKRASGYKERTLLSITVSSKSMVELFVTILTYEAGLRGSSRGHALQEMMAARVRRGGYPDELAARLRELDDARSRAAIEGCMGLGEIGPAA